MEEVFLFLNLSPNYNLFSHNRSSHFPHPKIIGLLYSDFLKEGISGINCFPLDFREIKIIH